MHAPEKESEYRRYYEGIIEARIISYINIYGPKQRTDYVPAAKAFVPKGASTL